MKPYEIAVAVLFFVALFSLVLSIWTFDLLFIRLTATSVIFIILIAYLVKLADK
jgi:hypothetical protein